MKSFSKSTILGLTFGILLAFGVAVSAFQSPTQAPPGGNVPAPLNTGPSDQTKTGGLLNVFGLWVNQSLGVTGGATFGGALNLQGNKITNVGAPTTAGDAATKGWVESKPAISRGKLMFESSGTFTVPAGVTKVWITAVGGGGGGGSGSASYADWSRDGEPGGHSCFQCGMAGEVRAEGGRRGFGGQHYNNNAGLPGEDSIFGVGAINSASALPYGAGGGGGLASHGGSRGGGGGGGGSTILFRNVTSLIPGNSIPVIVGTGGAGGVGYRYNGGSGSLGFVLVEW